MNNDPENLAVLTISDHKWLHKQFGVAVLWAFCRGRIESETLVAWSDDRERAKRLLPLNVRIQEGRDFTALIGIQAHKNTQ